MARHIPMVYDVLLRGSRNEMFHVEAESEEEAKFEVLARLERRFFETGFEAGTIENLVVMNVYNKLIRH